jgi:hypothetical protein
VGLKLSIIPGGLKIGSPWAVTFPAAKIEGNPGGGNGRLGMFIFGPKPMGILGGLIG